MTAGIESLLKEAIGLDAATIGSAAIARAVRARQAACRLDDPAAYAALARESPAELQELVDAVVVPETWFFRDRGALDAMVQILRSRAQGAGGRKLRLLSLPCSTGEEPYSMAMALLDAGYAPDHFIIDAIDVSSRSVALAQRAIYGRNAFRGADLHFRDRHFEAVEGGFRPVEAVRRSVRFSRGNMFDAGSLPGGLSQDVIFCRNLLIYFDRPTQGAALQVLHRLLLPGGFLFLGPSETALPPRQDFTWAKLPMAFAFCKAAGAAALPQAKAFPPPVPKPRPFRPVPAPAGVPQPLRPTEAPHPAEVERPIRRASLGEAQRLADEGHLPEAVLHCEAHIRENGPSADAFHLLGLLREAAGSRPEAIANHRKALYLDPHHQETLAHLALLLDQQGDRAGAKMLRDRLQRMARRSGS
ncbi:CheR family methyltransferase [Teichococcus oryzae]|uniref:Methyltransferase n=1 Tax=Teichococcus oryzae TaxID=1608942 RepID=A0A5B2TFC0_9PROT|nr:protein-glutamate O-methyltransferase CheR [Pseudoroseomonas oryzae]KAA2212588.1 methyltransferase [Pseudoroseomonas oryzae]